MKQYYMVEFELPNTFSADFLAGIPDQKLHIDKLMAEGTVQSYSLSDNRTRLWMIIIADSEFEVERLIHEFPLNHFMIPNITALLFHNASQSLMSISLN